MKDLLAERINNVKAVLPNLRVFLSPEATPDDGGAGNVVEAGLPEIALSLPACFVEKRKQCFFL